MGTDDRGGSDVSSRGITGAQKQKKNTTKKEAAQGIYALMCVYVVKFCCVLAGRSKCVSDMLQGWRGRGLMRYMDSCFGFYAGV